MAALEERKSVQMLGLAANICWTAWNIWSLTQAAELEETGGALEVVEVARVDEEALLVAKLDD